MTNKELFFQTLQDRFAGEGFVYLKSNDRLVKKESGNEYIINFNIWPLFLQVEVHYKILIKSVEDIKKKAWGKQYSKFESVGIPKRRIVSNPSEGIFWTEKREDILKAASSEFSFYNSVSKIWFEDNTNIFYLNKKLNEKPGSELFLAHNEIHTSFLAIIVAQLTENSNYNSLTAFYRTIIERVNPHFLEDYDLLHAYLNKSSQ